MARAPRSTTPLAAPVADEVPPVVEAPAATTDGPTFDVSDGAKVDTGMLQGAKALLISALTETAGFISQAGTQTNLVCYAYWQAALACRGADGFPDWAGRTAAFKEAIEATRDAFYAELKNDEIVRALKSAVSSRLVGTPQSAGYREAMITDWVFTNPAAANIPGGKEMDPRTVKWSGAKDSGDRVPDPSKGERPQVITNPNTATKKAIAAQYKAAGLTVPVKFGGTGQAGKNAKGTQDKNASPDKLTDGLVKLIAGTDGPALSALFASKSIERTLAALVAHMLATNDISEREETSAVLANVKSLAEFGERYVLPTGTHSPTAEEIDAIRITFPVGTTADVAKGTETAVKAA